MADVKKWLDEIKFTDKEKKPDKIRALVYGDSGSGKTHFAATAPSPFFFDSDKGMLTVMQMGKEVPYLTLERGDKVFKKIMDALKESKNPESEFFTTNKIKTIVFDSLTSLADMILLEAMLNPMGGGTPRNPNVEKPQYDDYNAVLNRTRYLMKFCQDLGYHIIALCGEKLEQDLIRGTFVGQPNIVGSYRSLVAYDFDEVYYAEAKEGKDSTRYFLYSKEHLYYKAKSRLGVANPIEDPTFEKVFKGVIEG